MLIDFNFFSIVVGLCVHSGVFYNVSFVFRAQSGSSGSANLENINYEPQCLDERSAEDVAGEDDFRIVFDLSVSLKNFQSQKNGTDPFVLPIRIASVDHFETIVWSECNTKLKREVLYDAASTILDWSPCKPQWEDRNRFFLFQDKAMKKTFRMDDLTMELLQGWHGRDINMFCLVYSLSLKSLKDFNTAKSKLMTCKSKDRAGADSNQSLQQLVVELKDKNNSKFRALETSYVLWANFIQDQPAYKQQDLIDGEPPSEYRHLFKELSGPKIDEQLRTVREDAIMADTVNEAVDSELQEIGEALMEVKESVRKLEEKFLNVQGRYQARRSVLGAVSRAVSEGEYSRSIAANIVDAVDVDHEEI